MQRYEDGILTLPASVIAIGAFDGVHQGHQAVIKRAVTRSKALKVPSVVYTFDPPPRFHFQKDQVLTPIDQKVHLIAGLGVDYAVIIHFDELYAKRPSIDFISNLKKLNPSEIIVGNDFRFGRNREGDIKLLAKHFLVDIIPPVCCAEGTRISSTRIRQLLQQGAIEQSNDLLGWSLEKEYV
ncbi:MULTISPECIES: FAD synthetase family protein [Priestia]|jgi:riboflavin kinase/FMN adenylyltransferase|uniref:FAD synthetase family protein n=1 Tax=Priestia TaxID=2800373 RepID=UPI001ADD0812|nr:MULTISPECIES: FAD synthetase family protein [Priestia]MDR7242775.1 riboflavin kinase/FMN adenylyltransferase [Priestia megaterium]QTL48092.1 FAD synthetase family protein [Priestia aryabhattai]